MDPDGSRMLDSIKATLTRVLGPESAQVVEFYVDKHLALKDPAAFEKALTEFLGSQAGMLLIDAIRSDLRNENGKSQLAGPISKFLRASGGARGVQSVPGRGIDRPTAVQGTKVDNGNLERFYKTVKLAAERGITLRALVTEGLVAGQGATCGYATLACIGRKAMDNPKAFAERAASLFGLEGMTTMLDNLTAFYETKGKLQKSAVF